MPLSEVPGMSASALASSCSLVPAALLGVQLRRFRQAAGLSLAAMAEQLQVSKSYLWEMEKGTRTNPGLHILERVRALTLQYPQALPAAHPEGEAALVELLAQAIAALSAEGKKALDKRVRQLQQTGQPPA